MAGRIGYAQIAAHYREKISSGALQPGDRMPTLREITAEHDVSMATAARAYKTLRAEGLTIASTGAGTVVAPHASPTVASRVMAHAATGRALSADETSQILEIASTAAPEHVASRMEIDPGTPVTMRRRLVSRDGVPTHATASYYPGYVIAAVPELTAPVSTGGSRELAADRLGSPQSRVLEEVTSRPASDSERNLLGISDTTATVTQVMRTVWLADGRIVEVAVKVSRGATVLKWASRL